MLSCKGLKRALLLGPGLNCVAPNLSGCMRWIISLVGQICRLTSPSRLSGGNWIVWLGAGAEVAAAVVVANGVGATVGAGADVAGVAEVDFPGRGLVALAMQYPRHLVPCSLKHALGLSGEHIFGACTA